MPRPPPGWLWVVVPRLALLVGVLNVVLLLFGVGLTAFVLLPQLGLLLLVPLFLGIRPRFRRALWSAGTASWEDTAGGLARAGMLSGDGLILGRAAAPSVKEAAKLLIRAPPRASPAVADTFLDSLWPRKGPWVRMNAGVNAVAFLPSGKGKGSSLVIPNLLTYQGSVVALDPKGELARASASWRRDRFGNEVVILDPFGQVTDTPDRWNPLDQIDPAAPDALDLVRAVAEALVFISVSEQEPHWNDGAESFIAALVAWVIHAGKPGVRDLQSVAELLASPKELQGALALMSQSKAHGGLLARMAHQLGHYAGEELGSVLTTTGRHLRFLATPAVVESTTATTFDPTRLRSGRMTIYLVLPTEYLRSHRALLRLWVSSLLRYVVRGGSHGRQKFWFVLDEAAALGHLECIDDAVTQMRGYGVRLLFMYQSLGQLRQCFPEGRDQTFLSNMD